MKTRLTELLGIDWPLIQAPMAGVSTPALAAAVSNAGGLGSIAVGALSAEAADEAVGAALGATNKPVNVNFFVHETPQRDAAKEAAWLETLAPHFEAFGATPPASLNEIYRSFNDDEAMFEMLLTRRPAVASFHFGVPAPARIAGLKEKGIVLIASATSLAEAKAVEAAGFDAVIAQGWEAGGHRGIFDPAGADARLSTMALSAQLVTQISIPVIAAGGIGDGRSIAAALTLGAEGVQLGTAFIACSESSANARYRAALLSARAQATEMSPVFSGRPARGLANRFIELYGARGGEVPAYPLAYDAGKALAAAATKAGSDDFTPFWAGQAAPLARALPAAELVAALMSDAKSALRRAARL